MQEQTVSFDDLPFETAEKVFSLLSFPDLLNCRLVCRKWGDTLSNESKMFWWKKSLSRMPASLRKFNPSEDINWMLIASQVEKQPLTRNLIKNSCAEDGLKYWNVACGNFQVEKPPEGADAVPSNIDNPEAGDDEVSVWSTSYMCCEKYQLVDLEKEGVHPSLIDALKPPIEVSEYHAARFDCGCNYRLFVELLGLERIEEPQQNPQPSSDGTAAPSIYRSRHAIQCFHDYNEHHVQDNCSINGHRFVVLDKFETVHETVQWEGRAWHRVGHTFRDYPSGVRYIRYSHYGKDTQFWAGQFGPKFTKSTVRFV